MSKLALALSMVARRVPTPMTKKSLQNDEILAESHHSPQKPANNRPQRGICKK
jgi:hypothetical protein